jgi:cell division protein FtsQ
MPKVTKPKIRTSERQAPTPALRNHASSAASYDRNERAAARASALRDKASTYAFGTVVCGAAMVAMAAWMGGSLGGFGESIGSGFNVISRAFGVSVDKIVIVGLDPEIEEKARVAARIDSGDSMFAADPYAIQRRIEALDAVAGVSVHRFWPDQVTIIAETRSPLALWEKDGEWRVIDNNGRTFAKVDPEDFMTLPRVSGEGADQAAAGLLAVVADYPAISDRLETAYRVAGRRWDMRFKGGVSVSLPEDAGIKPAMQALNLLETRNRLLELPLVQIDARHPDRFALRPAAGAPAQGGV